MLPRAQLWGFCVVALLLLNPGVLHAQNAQLEEIVVTAQKREENLQSVPLSLSAFSGDYLDAQNVQNLMDLKFRVPSLWYDERSQGQPRYYIRGIGNNIESGAVDEAVGVFVDGVYMARPEMTNNEFLDIERIEVLRGPQGTLFGRNVVGGAISVVTTKPDEEFRAKGSVTVGNYEQIDASGYMSGPLTDNLFAKVAFTTRNHDGYFFNTTTQNDVQDSEYVGARGALRWVPSDSLDIQLSADGSRRRGTGNWVLITEEGPVFTGKNLHDDPYRGPHHTDDGSSDVDNFGINLNIDWEIGLGTVTSITAYRESDGFNRFAATGYFAREISDPPDPSLGANTYYVPGYRTETEQFSQELRLASPAEDRFSWLVGLYYFNVDARYINTNEYRFIDLFGFLDLEGVWASDSDTETEAFAVFANASYDLTDRLSIQAGVRWSHDKKDTTVTTSGPPHFDSTGDPANPWLLDGVPVPGFTVSDDKSWSATTPSFSVNYQLTDDKFLYATVSRGFKSGGYESAARNLEGRASEIPFDPEYAWNYEIGAKTEWLDRRLRLNASLFYIDYTDLQTLVLVQAATSVINFISNAGEAESKGFELEADFAPVEGLHLFGAYTFTDTQIHDITIDGVDLSGNELGKAPKHKVFVGGAYTFPLNSWLNLTARLDYSYNSKYDSFPNNRDLEIVPSHENLNAGIGVEAASGRWGIELWGKNLTDELRYSEVQDLFGTGYALPFHAPLTYGVTVRASY